jgi:hypothetical protein
LLMRGLFVRRLLPTFLHVSIASRMDTLELVPIRFAPASII